MSSPEGDNTDFTEVKDLDKLFEMLTKTIEKLNKKLDDMTKTTGQAATGNKDWHKTQALLKIELEKERGRQVRMNKDHAKALSEGGNQMKLFTGMLTKGLPIGAAFGMLTGKAEKLALQYEANQQELASLESSLENLNKRLNEPDLDPKERGTLERAKEGLESRRDTAQGKVDESGQVAEKLAGAKEFFGKHKMGMMIGAGSAGVLIGILKKALDASPMFQQIYKLLNFGIMMILRPIGDFFGFLMRPIMIMLLRKFIIPWYTKMYPQMMKWGNEIGTKLAGALTALANGDIGGAFASLWGEVDWGQIIWDAVRLMSPAIAAADFIGGLFGVGDNTWTNEWGREVSKWFKNGLAQATVDFDNWKSSVEEWFSDGISRTYANWNKFWSNIWTWFSNGISGISAYWNNLWGTVYGWFWGGINYMQDNFKGIWETVYNWFWNGVNGIAADWSKIWDNVLDWLNPLSANKWEGKGGTNQQNNSSSQWYNPLTWAEGGHITEPIMGIGRSGQQYLMGEAGNETVIPDKKLGGIGGTNITINIQSMSGSQQDLNNLRQTILNVMQESNTRRGRV